MVHKNSFSKAAEGFRRGFCQSAALELLRTLLIWVVLKIGIPFEGPVYKGAVLFWGPQKETLIWKTAPMAWSGLRRCHRLYNLQGVVGL